ncbi:ClpXP protease specificity-enhancing factor [Photobacterium sp. WH77]|uniref:ClpXP protease specificity-enhancing factor n=1 Tax=Photobacterium arenosum TaxID=2774143 RepID=A0ABR9BKL1_9GAMM|nr:MULTISPECIES: ClpXP protease specificity-enhancing factor [Photobacterium]MBD8513088.1 ClpXP protease specificity-enhancing factor [Photobacterium arenosum]MBV7262022.1 ClpXP protease specificity-enhancing factor [Photobacterium sp. WH24]MCG2836586.1 ClpXP protease specificity-enhancing factor [Photobacterium sp. WH77]MCG2844287.1 ClpXP protease specificity-enhancing factor [Photobacterium sp. WH80]MDO6581965.1 ClpXP protease specificity-enhancing factor [Photobacterium sp. 2_MG-2023]
MEMAEMTPRRPYLVRAFYDWLVDNNLTPHLVVDATLPDVQVPQEFVSNGQIVLNLAPRAVGNLELGNDAVRFSARFGGRPHAVSVPLAAVLALYARENGAGTMFEPEPGYELANGEQEGIFDAADAVGDEEHLSPVSLTDAVEEFASEEEPPRPRGRPSLTVVK